MTALEAAAEAAQGTCSASLQVDSVEGSASREIGMQGLGHSADIVSLPEETSRIASRSLRAIFHDFRSIQDHVAGNVDVRWDLLVDGRMTTLVNQDFVFSVRRQRRIFERFTIVGESPVRLSLDISVLPSPRAVLLEMRAEGSENSVVERRRQDL